MIDKNQIQALIPHAGAMCLLEAVTAWDEQSIACVTQTHRDPANPLRRQGRLPAVMAFEYGGQAAAVHGGLGAPAPRPTAPPGALAALRVPRRVVADLDGIAEPLEIAAHLLLGDQAHCLYAIQVSAAGRLLAEARIAIVPQAAAETAS